MKTQIHEDPRIVAATERKMQAWVYNQETADRVIHETVQRRLAASGRTFVAISRECGSGGTEVARLLGERIGWEVLDKALLDRVAERFHEPRDLLDNVDETHSNWAYDVLGTWMDRQIVTHEKYVAHLTRVIRAAARRGKVVVVGRGAQFILPRHKGLAVRIVAPERYRIEQIMRLQSLSEADARRFMAKTDRDRREFVGRFFHRDVADQHLYDLVLNMERLGAEGAVAQIVVALCR
jgi:cytidylate kinase